jgi:peptidoglycan/xylan/chitin deacetylase (PgdA/CDA1 family)
MHFRYNISSRKFRKLIEELQQEGHETGLHSSLKAFDKSGKYSEERQKLEEITGKEIGGLRQHYLRAKFPRLWQMAANAGFIYDTSLGYNYQYGFRAGTCHPFRCYNYKTDKSLPLWEFSLAFFENNLPRDTENPEELIAVVERIIGKTEQYEGMVVGLLHPSNFLQPNFNRLWEWILNEIEKRGAFSATLSEMVEWITLKSKIETRIISGNEISIKKPAQVAIFSVELDEKRSLQPSPDYEFEQISGSRYRVSGSKTSFTLKTG